LSGEPKRDGNLPRDQACHGSNPAQPSPAQRTGTSARPGLKEGNPQTSRQLISHRRAWQNLGPATTGLRLSTDIIRRAWLSGPCHQWQSAHPSGSSFLWKAHVRQQLKKLLVGRALRGALDFPVTRDNRKAKRREDGAAAVLAGDLPFDDNSSADAISLVH
jgi:hypothetical protein